MDKSLVSCFFTTHDVYNNRWETSKTNFSASMLVTLLQRLHVRQK